MGSLSTVMLLVVAFLVVFCQATFTGFRNFLMVQFNFLPSLVVFASLSHGLGTLATLTVLAGLWLDSLSANPLGISILPLFLVGMGIQHYRGLILRDQIFAQVLLGLAASALTPVLTLLLLINVDRHPMIGWGSFWQWFIMSLTGAVITPFWFWFFDRVAHAVNYRPAGETSFRSDREIKRGRL